MPRKVRYILPNIPHHTIQRGNNRQNIFFDKEDYFYFLEKLKKQAQENEVKVGSYCLMTNPIHLLAYPKTAEGMIKCMKLTCQYYTQYINRKYQRTGKLWENRYKIHWVDPMHEWVLSRYIEKNPLRAKMVEKAEHYPYSSARGNLLGKYDKYKSKEIVPPNRRESYRAFFKEDAHKEREMEREINKRAEQEKAYGGEAFIKKLEKILGISVEYRKRGRPRKRK